MTNTLASLSPLRNTFKWDRRFSRRQPLLYGSADHRVPSDFPDRTRVETFLKAWPTLLDPPCCNFEPLKAFLDRNSETELENPVPRAVLGVLALLDDRRDPAGFKPAVEAQPETATRPAIAAQPAAWDGQSRNWETGPYSDYPPDGEDIWREVLDERGLYNRLSQPRTNNNAERRTLLITDLSALCAIAIAVTVAHDFAAFLRAHLLRYVCNSLSFRVKLTEYSFAMEFQLPYLALRTGIPVSDARRIRHRHEMLKHNDPSRGDLYYYEAQVAFLLTGYDEWHWTAYCCVDTYFGSERTVTDYIIRRHDGPSGGTMELDRQIWNPREYFLCSFSARLAQTTQEWRNLISELEDRLNSHEVSYNRSINTDDFFDDRHLNRTKTYTRAVSILRQCHDALATTTDAFQDFASTELLYFQTGSEILDRSWKHHVSSLFDSVRDLHAMQRKLAQRISTFDRMLDGLVNASAHKENRSIGVLTYATVAYLPFNLGAAIFSISNDNPQRGRVLYFLATSSVLMIFTVCIAFRDNIRKLLRNRTRRYGM